MPFCEAYLCSRFFLTKVTNVSISAAVMCFSNSFLLLCSRAVIVSSANTSYPICFCMKLNCLAMYSCHNQEKKVSNCINICPKTSWQSYTLHSWLHNLVLSVILLGMAQDSITKPANVSKWSMTLVSKFFQSKHGTIATICERGLEKFKNLQWKIIFFWIIQININDCLILDFYDGYGQPV